LRAGLLSKPQFIELINKKFVSTWIIIDDARKLADKGDPLAKTLATNFEQPLDFMFLTKDGVLINKLNSAQHLHHNVHTDVSHPHAPTKPGRSHEEVFLKHVMRMFGAD